MSPEVPGSVRKEVSDMSRTYLHRVRRFQGERDPRLYQPQIQLKRESPLTDNITEIQQNKRA